MWVMCEARVKRGGWVLCGRQMEVSKGREERGREEGERGERKFFQSWKKGMGIGRGEEV